MEQDPTRICELLVGLGDVDVLGVNDEPAGPLVVHVRTRHRPVCSGRGGLVWSKDTSLVRLVDLPAFGRAVRLVWCKWRWRCPATDFATGSFTETNEEIAPVRSALTTRAGVGQQQRWVVTLVRSPMWPTSWVVTGTQSTKRCSPGVRHCWLLTVTGSARWRRWGLMRPCSVVRVVGGLDGAAPRSWTCVAASCSTLWLVATRRHRSGGC